MANEEFKGTFDIIQKTSVELSDIYENIVGFDILYSENPNKKTEIINILNGFHWTINKSTGTSNGGGDATL